MMGRGDWDSHRVIGLGVGHRLRFRTVYHSLWSGASACSPEYLPRVRILNRMDSTPLSLLKRLREPADQDAWTRFVRLYTPLLCYWARRAGLREPDAADLMQEVFTLLVDKLPAFRHDGTHSFRAWLRTVTLNKWRERGRRAALPVTGDEATLAGLEVPDPLEAHWEADYRRHVVGQALRLMRAEFQPTTWRACWDHVVGDKSAAEVARDLWLTPGAVRAAKFRVLSRLRQELDGLLD